MSKNTQAAEEFLEEDVQDEVFAEETTNGSSHIFVKVLSVLLLAGLVAGFFAPVYFSFVDGTFNVYLNGSILGGEGSSLFNLMLTGIQDFMAGSEKSFALFARLVWTNKYLYGIAVAGVLLLITTIITLFTRKAAPVWFRIGCIIAMLVLAFYGGNVLVDGTLTFDIVMITGAVAVIFMVIHAFSAGAKGVAPAFCFILLIAALVVTALYSFMGEEDSFALSAAGYFFAILRDVMRFAVGNISQFTAPAVQTYELIAYISFAVIVVNLVLTAVQMGLIKSNAFTVIRYLVQLGTSVAAIVMIALNVQTDDMLNLLIPSIVVAVFALIAVLLTVIAMVATRSKEDETEEEPETPALSQAMDAVAQPMAEQPVAQPMAQQPVAQPMPAQQPVYGYGQQPPYGQPPYPYYQPAPNVYININPSTGAVTAQSAPVVAAPAMTQPAVEETAPKAQAAQALPVVITAPAPVPAPAAAPMPVVVQQQSSAFEPQAEAEEKPAKKRSFCVFLSLILALASVGVFVYHYWETINGFFSGFSTELFTDMAFLLPCGFALGVLIGFICSLVAFFKPSKVAAFFAFLFYALGAGACFADIQLNHGGIVNNITPDTDILAIAAMALIVLAVLFAFISIFRTRGVKKEMITEEAPVAEQQEAPVVTEAPVAEQPAVVEQVAEQPSPAPAVAPAPAPVSQTVASEKPLAAAPASQTATAGIIDAPAEEPAEGETVEEQTDAFMRTLSPADKREFKKVFLQGKAPAYLPAYEVGGDNRRFFDSVFVYLGKIRSVISDNLLGAMYDFMMANK